MDPFQDIGHSDLLTRPQRGKKWRGKPALLGQTRDGDPGIGEGLPNRCLSAEEKAVMGVIKRNARELGKEILPQDPVEPLLLGHRGIELGEYDGLSRIRFHRHSVTTKLDDEFGWRGQLIECGGVGARIGQKAEVTDAGLDLYYHQAFTHFEIQHDQAALFVPRHRRRRER